MPVQSDDAEPRQRAARQPPNYRARSVQLQLFVLVAALMTVLVAMNEARKPETWTWLTGRQESGQPPEPIDSRLPAEAESSANSAGPRGANGKALPDEAAGNPAGDERPSDFGWVEVYDMLGREDKQALARLLRSNRLGRELTPADVASCQAVVEKLDQSWERLLAGQMPKEQVAGSDILEAMNEAGRQLAADAQQRWVEYFRPALLKAIHEQPADATDQQSLRELQAILDRQDLAAVRDDTVWRPEEREAWFRTWERLQHTAPAILAGESVGEVSFVQIFRQSKEYRGKVVTLRGTARLGYRVKAPPNDLGIDNYVLLWVRPSDGTEVPVVVYALEVPNGFPSLTTAGQTPLREPVTVTGVFFKRWVYRAHDGLNSVPLLVALQPAWTPAPPPTPTAMQRWQQRWGQWSWLVGGGILIVLAGAATLLARLARGSNRSQAAAALAGSDGGAPDWTGLTPSESVEESLRRLAEREGDS